MPELSAAQIVNRWRNHEGRLGNQDNDRGGCSRNHRGSVDSEVVTMQNRMDELISKNQIIDFYNNNFPDLDDGVHWSRRDIIENLDNIPGLRVIIMESRDEPKKWIRRSGPSYPYLEEFECPCCGYDDDGDIHSPVTMYCPKCGQKLEGAE